MIYTAPCIMVWMRAYPLRGQVGGGWALEIESFLGPVKLHRADVLNDDNVPEVFILFSLFIFLPLS